MLYVSSTSVYRVKSSNRVPSRQLLINFQTLKHFSVGYIIQPRHKTKKRKDEISASGRGWAATASTRRYRSAAIPYDVHSTIGLLKGSHALV